MNYPEYIQMIKDFSDNQSIDDSKKLAFLAVNLLLFAKNHVEVMQRYLDIRSKLGGSWSNSIYADTLSALGFQYFTKQNEDLLNIEDSFYREGLFGKTYRTVGFYLNSNAIAQDIKDLYQTSMELVLDVIDISQNISINQFQEIGEKDNILSSIDNSLSKLTEYL